MRCLISVSAALMASGLALAGPAAAAVSEEAIARRIMDVCVEQRFKQGIDRKKIAPQCRCAAAAASGGLNRADRDARPAPGQALTPKQQSMLDASLPACLSAGDEPQTENSN